MLQAGNCPGQSPGLPGLIYGCLDFQDCPGLHDCQGSHEFLASHYGAREGAILVLNNLLDDRPRRWVAKRIHLENHSKMLSLEYCKKKKVAKTDLADAILKKPCLNFYLLCKTLNSGSPPSPTKHFVALLLIFRLKCR